MKEQLNYHLHLLGDGKGFAVTSKGLLHPDIAAKIINKVADAFKEGLFTFKDVQQNLPVGKEIDLKTDFYLDEKGYLDVEGNILINNQKVDYEKDYLELATLVLVLKEEFEKWLLYFSSFSGLLETLDEDQYKPSFEEFSVFFKTVVDDINMVEDEDGNLDSLPKHLH